MSFGKVTALPLAVVLALSPVLAGPAWAKDQAAGSGAAADQIKKIEDSVRVLQEMMKESDKGIPEGLVRDCAGIAIIPDVLRAGLVIGGRHGRGVLLVRTKDGGWSDPSFIEITGGSIGWQAGVQSADIILVFRTPRSVERIGEGKFTFGADAGIAAGPLGPLGRGQHGLPAQGGDPLLFPQPRPLCRAHLAGLFAFRKTARPTRDSMARVSGQRTFSPGRSSVPEAAAKLRSALVRIRLK